MREDVKQAMDRFVRLQLATHHLRSAERLLRPHRGAKVPSSYEACRSALATVARQEGKALARVKAIEAEEEGAHEDAARADA